LLSSVAFIAWVVAVAVSRGQWLPALYVLSFWHYYLYGLAFVHGAVSLDVFKRDAILTKAASLAALACAYLSGTPDLLSLAVIATGFLLNAAAAGALGADRTYYGHEVAGLPRRHITAFPYSWFSHPMLLGNIAAFGATLINDDFRRDWWPLACVHVVMNLGLLVMELAVTPQRRGTGAACGSRDTQGVPGATSGASAAAGCSGTDRASWRGTVAGAALGGGLGWMAEGLVTWNSNLLLGAGALAYAIAMFGCYTLPACPPDTAAGHAVQTEDSP